MRTVLFTMLVFCTTAIDAAETAGVKGNNTQVVIVNGSVTNQATSGATARVNVGSVASSQVKGTNRQTVIVSGSIVNSAQGPGSKSEVNIGSVSTSGN